MNSLSTTEATSAACWSCSAATGGAHFCPVCGKIQPLPRGADYFAYFGLPRKLVMDTDALEQRFHSLSWKLHPATFSASTERQLSSALATQRSYRTCRTRSRGSVLLALACTKEASETTGPAVRCSRVFG
jgi:hypothetical protein